MSGAAEWFDMDANESADVATRMATGKKTAAVEKTEAEYVHDALVSATTRDDLDEACNHIGMLPEADRASLMAIYSTRVEELDA
jgi:hypothetical protein